VNAPQEPVAASAGKLPAAPVGDAPVPPAKTAGGSSPRGGGNGNESHNPPNGKPTAAPDTKTGGHGQPDVGLAVANSTATPNGGVTVALGNVPPSPAQPGKAVPPPIQRLSLAWRRADQLGLIALLCVWVGVMIYAALDRTLWLGHDPAAPIPSAAKVEQVREKIDPNSASMASLCRLPLIGPSRAALILQYRTQHAPEPTNAPNPGATQPGRVFEYAEDLLNVHGHKAPGIGPGILARCRDFLALPSRQQPATAAAEES
jgi:hypothetical protein